MTIRVQGPDGVVVEFPDGTPPAEIDRAMRQHFGAPATAAPPPPPVPLPNGLPTLPAGAAAEPGFAPAPMSRAGLPLSPDMPTMQQRNDANWLPWIEGARDLTTNVGQGVLESIGALLPAGSTPRNGEPPFAPPAETTAGAFGRTIGHFVPGAVTMGPGAFAAGNAIRYGVIPGAAAEGVGQMADELSPEAGAYARAGAGILATLGMGLAGHAGVSSGLPRSQAGAAQIAGRALRDASVTVDEVEMAEALITLGTERGVQVTWPEALHVVTNGRVDLTTLQRVIEQSRTGQPGMSAVLGARPPQIRRAVEAETAAMAPLTPPNVIGPQIRASVESRVNDIRDQINAITRPSYRAAEPVEIDEVAFVRLSQDPLFNQAVRDVRASPVYSRFVSGHGNRSVAMMDAVKKYLEDFAARAAQAAGPRSTTAEAVFGSVAGDVRGAASRASPDYGDALATQAQLRQDWLSPLEHGVAGRLQATDDLAQQIRVLFPTSPFAGSQQEVTNAIRMIASRNPEAAQSVVRHHIEQVFNEAAQATARGPNPAAGGNFVAALQGNQQQMRNLEAAFRAAFPDGGERWAGFQRMMQVLDATGRRQPMGSPTAANLAGGQQIASAGTPAGTAITTALSPTRAIDVVGNWYGNFLARRNGRALADLITDPANGDVWRRLASTSPIRDATSLVGELVFGQTPQGATDFDTRAGFPSFGYNPAMHLLPRLFGAELPLLPQGP